MPVMPSFVERLMFLDFNVAPGPMLDMLGLLSFKTASTAHSLGVFDALGDDSLTAAELARSIEADERATKILLEALHSVGYIDVNEARYANTAMARKWMVTNSPSCIAGFMEHAEDLITLWGHLGESVRAGEPPISAMAFMQEEASRWKRYQSAMESSARMADEEILAKVKLDPTAKKLLDLGGGHGLHALAFCQQHPGMSVTVFDDAHAKDRAEANAAELKLSDRFEFLAGDFHVDDIGSGYDAALLFNIIHMFEREQNEKLLAKVAGSLNAGGMILIMDQIGFKPGRSAASATAALIGLNLFNAVGGETYSPADAQDMLRSSGFGDTSAFPLKRSPGFGLVRGYKR